MSVFGSFFGGGPKQPRTQQVVQQTKLPEEIAPYAKEVLEDAKAQYLASIEKGYDPYTGQTIAPQTQEQLEAQAGLKALVGTQRPLQEEALAQYRTGLTERFTPEAAQEYMSPYQRAVTDIEKREAQKVFESQIMPQFEKQAVAAGGMSGMGSRAGVQAAQLGQAQMQQMGDIESKGLQAAYKDAQNLFQQQQIRERQAATDIAGMAPAMLASGVTEQGLLQSIGEEKQTMGQQALNEAYFRHLEEQAFPQEQLAGYSGFVYGNPLMQQRTMTETSPAAMGPSKGSQLMGLGMTAAKMYGMGGGSAFGGSGFTMGNLGKSMFTKTGGRLSRKTGGGLSSLPVVYRQDSGNLTETQKLERIYADPINVHAYGVEPGYTEDPERIDYDPDPRTTPEARKKVALLAMARDEREKLATIQRQKDKERSERNSPENKVEDLIKQSMARRRKGQLSPEDYTKKLTEDRDKLRDLYSGRKGERETARKSYEDRMEEARKRTFEEQRGLVPTGHAGYERAMRSLLRGTAAGAPQRGLLESFLGAGTEMIGGIREGETAKQKALAEIEQRRGTAEMGDIKDYERMRAADEAAAYKSELDMVKNINPSLWKAAQEREAKLRKEGLDEAHIRAQMTHYLGQAQYNKARALAELGIGAEIKPGVYNAIRGTFKDMVEGGMFTGVPTADGGFVVTGIRGKGQIKPADTAEINKILADALEIKDVSKAAKFIQDKLAKFGQGRADPKHKKGHKIKVELADGTITMLEYTGEKGDKAWKDVGLKE